MSLAALGPISPAHLKLIFELHGYKVTDLDEFNWVLDLEPPSEAIILPRLGDLVPLEILMDTGFTKAGMDLRTYLKLRAMAERELSLYNN